MKYQTIEGILYDVEELSREERELFDLMYKDSLTMKHWTSILARWGRPVESLVTRTRGFYDTTHPLVRIELDLLARVGVRNEQLSSERVYPDPIIKD